ncbi:BZIP domain-containing protein [Chloropicon primus]|uniref:BZIP domain-containing protein n=1 Tax=Chloropicon primus TaxID=1764295 RepID=A0A5B8MFR4_9CHLO|nr:hypothetical protein A3770_03p20260 [Chloropicon primus]UPQ98719.1 BZIP domain-containing protein [Chloropicon primus]|mmetsp:Transcript_11903/g.32891  ORF Transcript_11903/g.32891 Transcript_11903/m.32891 type:complete len:223 (-) Transcript_11903:139-807(-)|eukprot:QDZ19508.1 hypothetical protein A3770_03p20260 [Chloropicon primus]
MEDHLNAARSMENQTPEFCAFCSEVFCHLPDAHGNYCGNCCALQKDEVKEEVDLDTGLATCGGLGAFQATLNGAAGITQTAGKVIPVTSECPAVVQHEHETFFEGGVEYKKCTQVRKVQSKCKKGNRLAVQKYRQKKKNEFEMLKKENAELKAKVAKLESIVKYCRGGDPNNETTASQADELWGLRLTMQRIRELVSAKKVAEGPATDQVGNSSVQSDVCKL